MKMIKTITQIILLFLLTIAGVNAQQVDEQRLDRDIRIAEGILTEMFSDNGNNGSYSFRFPGSQAVNGEYIPGAGVHFTIAAGSSHRIQINTRNNGEDVQVEVNNHADSDSSEREEEIQQKIIEYFKTYAPLISDLPGNESVRVTYGANRPGPGVQVYFFDDNRHRESGPAFSMWVRASDLRQFKNGDLNESRFEDRINKYDLTEIENKTDLNVFASVLETALKDAETEHLHVTRKPRADYLPGLGVYYQLQVSTRPNIAIHGFHMSDDNFEIKMDSMMIDVSGALESLSANLAPLAERLDILFEDDLTRAERDSIRREAREVRQRLQAERDSLSNQRRRYNVIPFAGSQSDTLDLTTDKEAIMNQLRDVIEDYGSTLSSLSDDELLMITVNWGGRNPNLPLRTEIRIKKSALLNGEQPSVEEIVRR
ncbi:MAG: hypothetical protein WEA56_13270 [Balneolaceae bacterium]